MRPLRLVLLLALLLALLAGLYGGAWYVLAGRVRGTLEDWAGARRAAGYKAGWDRYTIDGFPLALRVTLEKPVYGKSDAAPGFDATAAQLIGTARPWTPRRWHVTAPSGARIVVEPATARPQMTLDAATLDVAIAPAEPGALYDGTAVILRADGVSLAGDGRADAAHAELHTVLPPKGGAGHLETWLVGAIELNTVTLPSAVPPIGRAVDRVTLHAEIKGEIPSGKPRQALDSWRRDGGTFELDGLELAAQSLLLTASGTIALDDDLQPVGALTATIGGYGEVIDALTASGQMKDGDAQLAKIALGLLAKPGPDGIARVTAPLTLQGGKTFLGPARLAPLPHFTWE